LLLGGRGDMKGDVERAKAGLRDYGEEFNIHHCNGH